MNESLLIRVKNDIYSKLMNKKKDMATTWYAQNAKGQKEKDFSMSEVLEYVLIENEDLKKENDNLRELLGGYKSC
jgi:regulator of replication initiation timing